jgi:hypothetical protein
VLEGLNVSENVESGQDIDFVNEACRGGPISSKYLSLFKNLFSTPTEAVPSEFFRHPIAVATGTLGNSSSIVGAIIQQNAATIQGQPIWANKLAGYAGFRATWCVKFEVAPNPFCSGVFRIVHQPANKGGTTGNRARRPYMWDLPGVTLNLSENTSACLKVPHSTIFPYLTTTNTPSSNTTNGNFIIWNINGVQQGTGSAALTATTWLWLEDVELIIPVDSTVTNLAPQSGMKMPVSKGDKEVPKDSISTVLNRAARVSNSLSGVPFLGDVAGPAAWTFRFGAKLASAFGYAKPLRTVVKTVKLKPSGNHYNADGEDSSYNLSYIHDSVLAPMSIEGRPLDEMSFDFLTRVPHFITQVNLASQTTGTLLAKGFLSPLSLFTQGSTVTLPDGGVAAPFTGFFPSGASAVASCFVQYRGDFVFKFIIQKTRFHSGRLIFGYNYYMGDNTTYTTINVPDYRSPYMHRTVIDLNQTSEFEVKIPFQFPANLSTTDDYIGTWGLWVLEPVSAPPAAPATIPINLVASMENCLFAAPRTSVFAPTNNYNNLVYQSGMKGVAFQAALSGEDLMSVKQLCMKAGAPMTVISNVPYFPWPIVYPTYAPNTTSPTSVTLPTNNPHHNMNLFRTAYAFERGAVNMQHAINRTGTTRVYLTPPSFGTRPNSSRAVVPSAVDSSNNMAIFKINRYCNLPGVYTDFSTTMPREAGSYANTGVYIELRDANDASVASSVFSFCAADDFFFHSFQGFEPVIFAPGTEMA